MEPRNAEALGKICLATNIIPMNTWKRTPLTKKERNMLRAHAKPKDIRERIMQKKTHTWTPGRKHDKTNRLYRDKQ